MLIAIVLDRPLAEAKALVEALDAFIQAITRIMQDKQNHPVIAQMIRPSVSDDLPPAGIPIQWTLMATERKIASLPSTMTQGFAGRIKKPSPRDLKTNMNATDSTERSNVLWETQAPRPHGEALPNLSMLPVPIVPETCKLLMRDLRTTKQQESHQ